MTSTVITEIVSQHAEEAAFLWLLRSNAIRQPHYALKDLAKLDHRVEAHLDGLRVAGEPGWELCKAALGNEENCANGVRSCNHTLYEWLGCGVGATAEAFPDGLKNTRISWIRTAADET